MSWYLEIQTTDKDHSLYFPEKAEADEAFAETTGYIGKTGAVTIAGQLSLGARTILSARVVEKGIGFA